MLAALARADGRNSIAMRKISTKPIWFPVHKSMPIRCPNSQPSVVKNQSYQKKIFEIPNFSTWNDVFGNGVSRSFIFFASHFKSQTCRRLPKVTAHVNSVAKRMICHHQNSEKCDALCDICICVMLCFSQIQQQHGGVDQAKQASCNVSSGGQRRTPPCFFPVYHFH